MEGDKVDEGMTERDLEDLLMVGDRLFLLVKMMPEDERVLEALETAQIEEGL